MDDKSQTHYWGIVVKCHIVSHDRPATQDITGAGSMRSGGGRGEECKSTVDRRHEGGKKERKKERNSERNSIKQLHQSRTAQYLLFSYCRDLEGETKTKRFFFVNYKGFGSFRYLFSCFRVFQIFPNIFPLLQMGICTVSMPCQKGFSFWK